MSDSQPPNHEKNSSFGKDVLKLVSGTSIAQLLTILAAPLLTRLYNPEAFGVVALFVSITAIITVISCMRYELAIMLPEKDEDAANLLAVSLSFVVIITVVTIPIIWFGKPLILSLLNAPTLAPYLWLIPPMILFSGAFLALNYWNSRTKQFGRLSIARVFKSVVTTGTQLGAGFAGYGTGGSLVSANVAGTGFSTLVLGRQIWRDDSNLLRKHINFKGMIAGMKRHYKFPLYNTWAALFNNVSWQLPAFMLSAFFSPTVVGYYALSNRLLKLPMNLIGSSIGQVFFQRAAEKYHNGEISGFVKTIFWQLVYYGIFPFTILTLIGSEVFITVFGNEWLKAGIYVQILSPYIFFNFISSPMSQLFSIIEKQETPLLFNVVLLISRFIAILIGGILGSDIYSIFLYSMSGILIYSFYSLYILKSAKISVKYWAKTIIFAVLISITIIGIAWLISLILSFQVWQMLVMYVIITLLYYYVLNKYCKRIKLL